jgi:hypothetical protein
MILHRFPEEPPPPKERRGFISWVLKILGLKK